MLNRTTHSAPRRRRQSELHQPLLTAGPQRHGTVYHPRGGHIVGFNFGSSVRPDVSPIAVSIYGDETVASFLARGGVVKTVPPKIAKGAFIATKVVRSRPTRVIAPGVRAFHSSRG